MAFEPHYTDENSVLFHCILAMFSVSFTFFALIFELSTRIFWVCSFFPDILQHRSCRTVMSVYFLYHIQELAANGSCTGSTNHIHDTREFFFRQKESGKSKGKQNYFITTSRIYVASMPYRASFAYLIFSCYLRETRHSLFSSPESYQWKKLS